MACLNNGRVLACQMWLGRVFQREGAPPERALCPPQVSKLGPRGFKYGCVCRPRVVSF